MSLSRRSIAVSWLLAAALTLSSFPTSHAQTCYYPDGKTISTTDIPCNATASASSCCGSDQFCLVGGLCFGGGIVSRASCTDKTWDSEACSEVCRTDTTDAPIAITPCTSEMGLSGVNQFVCGVNTTQCLDDTDTFAMSNDLSFLLRPAQVAALVQNALAAEAPPTDMYTVGQVVGVAVAIGVPCLLALAALIFMLRRERRKTSRSKVQYKPHDSIQNEKFTWQPGYNSPYQAISQPDLPIPVDTSPLPSPSLLSGVDMRSRASSTQSMGSEGIQLTSGGTLVERYAVMKQKSQVQAAAPERHELESTPTSILRYELGDKRLS